MTVKVTVEFIEDMIKNYAEGDLVELAEKYGYRSPRELRSAINHIKGYGVPIPKRSVKEGTAGHIQTAVFDWAKKHKVEIKGKRKDNE